MNAEAQYCPNHPDRIASTRCQGCGRALCGGCVVPLQGRELCQECKYGVLACAFRVGEAIPIQGAAGNLVALETDARALGYVCATHPESPAVTLCERCGDYMCPLCIAAFQGRFYCTGCFDLMWRRRELGASKGSMGGWALGLAIVASGAFLCVPSLSSGNSSNGASDLLAALWLGTICQIPALICALIELRGKSMNRSITQSRLAWAALAISCLCVAGFPLAVLLSK